MTDPHDSNATTLVLYGLGGSEEFSTKQGHTNIQKHVPPWAYSTIFAKSTSIGTMADPHDSNDTTLVLYGLRGSEEFSTKQGHTNIQKHVPPWP